MTQVGSLGQVSEAIRAMSTFPSGANMKAKLLFLLSVLSVPACVGLGQSPYYHRDRGLGLGALVGAVTGGAIGNNNGQTVEGALIGGAVGALTGAAIGDSVDVDIARNNAVYEQRMARQMSQAVSVSDVMTMTQSRLSDSVIVTHIRTYGVAARPQANDLILLSNAGVSEAVINAMQTAPLAVAEPAPAPPPAYRNVIVREHYYAPPVYAVPVAPYWCRGPRPPYPMHGHPRSPGMHWGFSISR